MSSANAAPPGAELEAVPNLFAATDPVDVIPHAERIAGALKETLRARGMVLKIGRNEHVLIDGWQTLGAMLGVSAQVAWSKPCDGGNGWEARAEARRLDGTVVGSAEAMCTRDERNWKNADEYAIRSMAQTRAMSKALRGPLGFVVALGGLDTTPAEEVPRTDAAPGLPEWARTVDDDAGNRTYERLAAIYQAGDVLGPEALAVAHLREVARYCDDGMPGAVALAVRLIADATTDER